MTKKPRGDINFELPGGVKMSLVPLARKDAGRVFHTVLVRVAGLLAAAAAETDDRKQIAAVAASLEKIPFDDVWDLAALMCAGAVVNGAEIESLDDVDALGEEPYLLYLIVYQGIKGNWPRLFSDLRGRLAGFAPGVAEAIAKATADQTA